MKKITCVLLTTIALIWAGVEVFFSENAAPRTSSSVAIQVRTGDVFTITLESNPTTGYLWQLAEQPAVSMIEFVKSEYAPDDTGLVGSGGREVWTFKAVGEGKAELLFKYARPWEKDTPPIKKEIYEVSILSSK